jgi:predicted ATPase/DNA-binding SARP family transcriptional activator
MPAKGTTISARVLVLCSFELEINGKVVRLPTRKSEGLLAYLVLHRNVQSREKIAALFWGDSSDELARRSLRTALSFLRKELGENFVVTDRETIQLNPNFPIWVDAQELEKQANEILSAHQHTVTGMDPGLYRGDLLQDFYDEWVLDEREQYRILFINALQQVAQSLKTNAEYQHAIVLAQKIISVDIANERAYQLLIFCYGMLGKRLEALKSYEECKQRLMEHLGVEPAEDTIALYEQVKKSKVSSTSLNLARSNLPIPLTSFIGREQEIETLIGIFDTTRLLTLTGVGGCGKTRLSIQLAEQISDQYSDGVWWFELAAIQDEALLLSTIKKTLGLNDSQVDSAEESIIKFLHSKNILLILDNCEHLITACARFAEKILGQCPALKILATSREALSIYGEIAWLVPSLDLPPADQINELLKWEAPRLFFERATNYRYELQLTEPNAEAVLRICRALEGIPLAIELAAARVKTLSLEQLAARLDDKLALLTTGSRAAQPRQQTLRAAIDWSYELLSAQEQIVLQRLSVFSGTWTLEAAEFVCTGTDVAASQILDLVTRLLDKSLIVSENHEAEMRYRMLEIIRQYTYEKLEQSRETEKVQGRHTHYYLELAQRARPLWFTPEHLRLIKQFDVEYPNLRGALAWSVETQPQSVDWERGLQLAVELGPLWNFLGEYHEGLFWLKKVMEQSNACLVEADLGSELRRRLLSMKARALYEYGFLIWFQSQYTASQLIFAESAEIFKQLDEPGRRAYSDMFLAHSVWLEGKQAEARQLWTTALDQFRSTGDLWGAGMVHSFLGRTAREAGNYEQAELEYNQCMELFSAVGDGWGLGITLSHRGMIAFQQNNPEKARQLFEQRLSISREHGFRQSTAYSSCLLGIAAWKLNDPVQVQIHMRAAGAHFLHLGNYITLTDCLVGLACAELELGHPENSAYIVGAIQKAEETFPVRMSFEEMYFHKPVMADLKSRLDLIKYEKDRERGYKANLDEVAKDIIAG